MLDVVETVCMDIQLLNPFGCILVHMCHQLCTLGQSVELIGILAVQHRIGCNPD